MERHEVVTGPLTYFKKIYVDYNYATWDVNVAAFTEAGDGPSVAQSAGENVFISNLSTHFDLKIPIFCTLFLCT